jgi:hypothetical protein
VVGAVSIGIAVAGRDGLPIGAEIDGCLTNECPSGLNAMSLTAFPWPDNTCGCPETGGTATGGAIEVATRVATGAVVAGGFGLGDRVDELPDTTIATTPNTTSAMTVISGSGRLLKVLWPKWFLACTAEPLTFSILLVGWRP